MSTKVIVCLLNGIPGSGKDQLVEFAQEIAKEDKELQIANLSMIDGVRGLLNIDKSQKDPATRKVLATVGDALEEYNGFKSSYIITRVMTAHDYAILKKPMIVFVHVREMAMIEKLYNQIRRLNSAYISSNTFVVKYIHVVRDPTIVEVPTQNDHEALRVQQTIFQAVYDIDNPAKVFTINLSYLPQITAVLNTGTLDEFRATTKELLEKLYGE